jgi:hypothetical protein
LLLLRTVGPWPARSHRPPAHFLKIRGSSEWQADSPDRGDGCGLTRRPNCDARFADLAVALKRQTGRLRRPSGSIKERHDEPRNPRVPGPRNFLHATSGSRKRSRDEVLSIETCSRLDTRRPANGGTSGRKTLALGYFAQLGQKRKGAVACAGPLTASQCSLIGLAWRRVPTFLDSKAVALEAGEHLKSKKSQRRRWRARDRQTLWQSRLRTIRSKCHCSPKATGNRRVLS